MKRTLWVLVPVRVTVSGDEYSDDHPPYEVGSVDVPSIEDCSNAMMQGYFFSKEDALKILEP